MNDFRELYESPEVAREEALAYGNMKSYHQFLNTSFGEPKTVDSCTEFNVVQVEDKEINPVNNSYIIL